MSYLLQDTDASAFASVIQNGQRALAEDTRLGLEQLSLEHDESDQKPTKNKKKKKKARQPLSSVEVPRDADDMKD
ncbi:hypothetical protein H0H87_009705, partial [Tephrocybe sp. NHM501043]